jgi:hypothetical protein
MHGSSSEPGGSYQPTQTSSRNDVLSFKPHEALERLYGPDVRRLELFGRAFRSSEENLSAGLRGSMTRDLSSSYLTALWFIPVGLGASSLPAEAPVRVVVSFGILESQRFFWVAAPRWQRAPQRHIPRMRAAISTRTPRFAPLAANSGSTSGQVVGSKSPSSSSGMKRLRDA